MKTKLIVINSKENIVRDCNLPTIPPVGTMLEFESPDKTEIYTFKVKRVYFRIEKNSMEIFVKKEF